MKSTATILTAAITMVPGLLFAQQTFDTPQAAADALIQATQNNDTAQLQSILGPQGQQILTSGKTDQDKAERTEFARLAAERHQVEADSWNPNRAMLYIGSDDWPFPVPIVRTNGKWSFDAGAGRVEMRARRIGANELDALEICAGYVEAQKHYAEQGSNPGGLEYASRILSSPGKHDGLYWNGATAPLVPKQFAEDAGDPQNPKPYHGYYFAILTSQGPAAPGGQHNYLMKGQLAGGFGLVAWPAQYNVTGVHTFIVNQDGTVYEKDLGPRQGKTGPPVSSYNPDPSWNLVQ